jgi:hypothetical protein
VGHSSSSATLKDYTLMKMSDEYLKKQSHLINTVKENRVGYTQGQFDKAKRVLDRPLMDVQRGDVTLHFEDVKREDLWRTVLPSGLISLSIDNKLY